jgi:hypothetical protein
MSSSTKHFSFSPSLCLRIYSIVEATRHARNAQVMMPPLPVGSPKQKSPVSGRMSHRLVKNPENLSWGKEPAGSRGGPGAGIDSVAHVPSALDYFLSTSPRQGDKTIKQLLHSMDYGATKKLSSELDRFERSHNAGMGSDDDDEHDAVVSPRKPQRAGSGPGNVGASPSAVERLPPLSDGMSSSLQARVSSIDEHGNGIALPPQEYLPGKRVPVVSSNPITGILCNVPLHKVFGTYRDHFVRTVRQRRVSQTMAHGASAVVSAPSKKEPMRINVDDFMHILHSLLPTEAAACVSREYAKRMLEPFGTPGPYGAPPKIPFPTVFSYLCKCYGHSIVEKNVRFLTKCLDPKSKGGIPYSVFTGRVVRAWAENRVIGGAIYGWRALASALEAAGDIDARLLEDASVITKDELRMIAYTTEQLTEAMMTDLECDITTAPRFPTLPNAKGSDDASSIVSGGRAVNNPRRGVL